MSKNKDQFLTMLVELCRAYDVTYHDGCGQAFQGWDTGRPTWALFGEELEQAINKEAK